MVAFGATCRICTDDWPCYVPCCYCCECQTHRRFRECMILSRASAPGQIKQNMPLAQTFHCLGIQARENEESPPVIVIIRTWGYRECPVMPESIASRTIRPRIAGINRERLCKSLQLAPAPPPKKMLPRYDFYNRLWHLTYPQPLSFCSSRTSAFLLTCVRRL